ncbi:RTA-like protein [Purpureocillium lavendulum]|uniref:Inheritance of peroxisomes protein 1 n=1 Tax=Purpureocillium lavendulum TaxID=1247861 RepID=A0AB34FM44_9HYPO|nr:RTA-like protein [Purpureocillium lavendulum]
MDPPRAPRAPRRVATAPITVPVPAIELGSTAGVETLYSHPHVKIISFEAHARRARDAEDIEGLAAAGNNAGTLPWTCSLERIIAVGAFRVYRAPGSVAFLSCGSALQPILPKSQCWCVDEDDSKFVLQIRRPAYWRIELPVSTPDERVQARIFRDVLANALQFEKTRCPFRRSFTVALPQSHAEPAKKRPWTPRLLLDPAGTMQPPGQIGTFDGSYFFYAPNKGAAIFFAIAFLFSGVLHTWQACRYKCWKLTPLFPFCCLLFVAGFALREYGAFHYDNLNVYIASICITYAAPPLLELQNYHVLGRILYYVPYLSPLHPGRVLTTFGFVSAIVEALNGWGASYSANQSLSDGEMAAGHALIKASLLIQIFVISCFILLAALFHRRCSEQGIKSPRLCAPLVTLYVSTGLILVRTIYRIVEYFSIAQLNFRDPGFDSMSMSPIIRYEWFFYVFEASVMVCNCVLFNARHPRRYLPCSNTIYLAQDGVAEVEGPGFKDPRPFWQTVVDPFDLWGLSRGHSSQTARFWEDGNGGAETDAKAAGASNANSA